MSAANVTGLWTCDVCGTPVEGWTRDIGEVLDEHGLPPLPYVQMRPVRGSGRWDPCGHSGTVSRTTAP